MEVQLDNAETPEVCQKMIQFNYLGGLAFTCSKLPPPLRPIKPVMLEQGTEIREEQLEFLGWVPLRPRIRQLEAQKQAFSNPKSFLKERDSYEERLERLEEQIKRQVEDELRKNLERANAWQLGGLLWGLREV